MTSTLATKNTLTADSILKDISNAAGQSATALSEFFSRVSAGMVDQAALYRQMANAAASDCLKYAEKAREYAAKAASSNNSTAEKIYSKMASAMEQRAGEYLGDGGEALAKAISSESVAGLSKMASKVGPLGDALQLGMGIYEGYETGDWGGAAGAAGSAIGGWAGATLGATLVAAVFGVAAVATLGGAAVIAAAAVAGAYVAGELAENFYEYCRDTVFPYWRDWFNNTFGDGTESIPDGFNDKYNDGRSAIVRRDPLILDLDGDGLETVGANDADAVMFDHDGDGVKAKSG